MHEAYIGYAGYFRAGIGFRIYPGRGIETRFMGQKCHRATFLTRDHDLDTPPGVSRAACFILIFRDNLLSSSRGMLPPASTTHDLAGGGSREAAAPVLNKPTGSIEGNRSDVEYLRNVAWQSDSAAWRPVTVG